MDATNSEQRVLRYIELREAVSLDEELRQMNSSERSSVLAAKCGNFYFGFTPLMFAVTKGYLNIVKVLLKYKADMTIEDTRVRYQRHSWLKRSPFFDDFFYPFEEDIDLVEYESCTPLLLAAAYGRLDILRCLMEAGADTNACLDDNCTPLMMALEEGHINVATFLIEHGAKLDLQDDRGCTALHYALNYHPGSLEVISRLIENGVDVNACTNINRCTPLMIASRYGQLDAMNTLIKHGANVNHRDKDGKTALHYALSGSDVSCEILSCLIENGADPNAFSNKDTSVLFRALENDKITEATFLIEHGANVNGCSEKGCTAVMLASRFGNLDIMTFLIKHGANVNLQDKEGETALHYAINGCDYSRKVLSCLIENGADLINDFSNDGCTPLMIAISRKVDTNVAITLTDRRLNIDLQDKSGNTALHYAVSSDSPEMINCLVNAKASNVCNNQGLTPLLLASSTGRSRLVKFFIKRLQITKEQRIDALELLGAFLILEKSEFNGYEKGLKYIKRGMEERFSDPSHPLLKQPMEPVEAFQNRKESQTPEELAQIEDDVEAVVIEGVLIRERIIGNESLAFPFSVRSVAQHYNLDFSTCMGLYRYVVKMYQSSNHSAVGGLDGMFRMLHEEFKRSHEPKAKNYVVELLELTVLDYETQHTCNLEFREMYSLPTLFDISVRLVLFISKVEFHGESKTSYLSTLLRKLCRKDPQDSQGNRLLHNVIECHMNDDVYSCLDALKLLLNAGFNVNAKNNKGNTPLHIAAALNPRNDKLYLVTEILQVLIDGGSHDDFVNSDGKTPLDMAKTDVAHVILSERRNLVKDLQCISAKAVRKHRIPYTGVVPVLLEEFISMH